MASISLRLAVVMLLATFASCGGGGSTTPTVPEGEGTVLVQSETLVPVTDACHMQGVVANVSERTKFDVTLRWQAFDAAGVILGATQITIPNLLVGEQRPYDASGFASDNRGLVPCSAIARFERTATLITPH